MARIKKILRWENHDTYALVYAQMESGDEEYTIFVGGDCELMHHWGRNKAWVKKAPTPDKDDKHE